MESEWASNDALVGMPDERQHHILVFRRGKFHLRGFHRLRHVVVQHVQGSVNVFDGLDAVDVESAPTQPNAVDADVAERFSCCLDVRGHIFATKNRPR